VAEIPPIPDDEEPEIEEGRSYTIRMTFPAAVVLEMRAMLNTAYREAVLVSHNSNAWQSSIATKYSYVAESLRQTIGVIEKLMKEEARNARPPTVKRTPK
jgi:tRNA A37 methylthiotransferase MiaB